MRFIKRNLPAIISLVLLATAILYLGLRHSQFTAIAKAWGRIDAADLAGAIVLTFLAQLTIAWRCRIIYEGDGLTAASMTLANLRIQLVSLFAGHCAIVPGFADIAKGTMVKLRYEIQIARALKYVVYERVCTAVGYMMVGILAMPFFFSFRMPFWLILAPALIWLGGGILLAAIMFMARRPVATGKEKLDRLIGAIVRVGNLYHDPRSFAELFLCGLAQIALNAGTFALLAKGMALPVPPGLIYIFTPFIIFISSLPIFYMGWGGREAAVIMTLGTVAHLATADALALSAAYGVVVFLTALPGAVLWLLRPSMRKPMEVPLTLTTAE
ncbi:MAG TPA: lysylphosphatidylglycerol synthase transmembrane domain-containing protein [Methylovirgula sp.]|nr:lysylphosphatidylglycerol synthase transmembrane domain-containing protein [Methylovirgula sp.]